MALHLMKLVVGFDSLRSFAQWQQHERMQYHDQPANIVRTRHTPKQAELILQEAGSIYRIIKGAICCRQKIIGFEKYESDDGAKCLILTDTDIIQVRPLMRRPFQGWRYLKDEDAPPDIGRYDLSSDEGSQSIMADLTELGLL